MTAEEQVNWLIANIEDINQSLKNIALQQAPNKSRLLSIEEASNYYNISRKRLQKAIRSGAFKTYRLNGRDITVKQGDIEKWIDAMGTWGGIKL